MEFVYVEMDPSERYGRSIDVLGKGAMKTVYRAFDEILGMEVAWNQVKLNDAFSSPEEMQRLYSEVHLLKNLNHESITKSRASWIDVDQRTFNFITELFTSGTLREYRKKYPRVNIRAIKDWARQILEGLDYLHGHDPPVIHRDLKCDNIFVNGHLGQVKIGDLGLAAILGVSHRAHSVIGTPEFMAPEMYEEDYDELVDIYSFGMCVLEMLTSEYPYSECTKPAQIYKKVTSGKLPNAFFQIDNAEAQRFVRRCLEKAASRPCARELLMDPFLSTEEVVDFPATTFPYQKAERAQRLMQQMEAPARSTDMSITGTLNSEDGTIDLKVQISDKNGIWLQKYIDFSFDATSDTSFDVATEMVKELKLIDWDPSKIADMIDGEVSTLIPSWKNYKSSQTHQQQHSFDYVHDDEYNDDNSHYHPFYATSSLSSSQASLPGILSLNDAQYHQGNSLHEWLQEESKVQDDASYDSSSFSYKYSNLKYSSSNEDDYISTSHKDEQRCASNSNKATRFCPEGSISRNFDSAVHQQRMAKSGSMIDIRSQLLHRALVDEIKKRRSFKTVAAVENIGYHEPNI